MVIGAETAHAPAEPATPRSPAAATRSPLYLTGRLTRTGCAPGPLAKDDAAGYRRFLRRLTGCLNRAWAAEFRQARLPFTPPLLRFTARPALTPCGPWAPGADGVYCSADRTIYLLVDRAALRRPFALGVARLLAHEYGHHVQASAGIWHYYRTARAGADQARLLLLSRRSELQAECLSAVFMRSVSRTFPVDAAEWRYAVGWFRRNGHKSWTRNDHGSGATQAAWMERGFAGGSPSACDTWSASPESVS